MQDSKKERYIWWKDNKIMGMIFLVLIVTFQLFAYLPVPFFTTIYSYTVGMLFGYYSPLFFAFLAYLSLSYMTNKKFVLPKWFKLNNWTYWFVVISILFIASSTGYYQSKSGFTVFGSKPWQSFANWFNNFTDNQKASWWLPHNTNGGLIGVFLYSLFATIFSGVGALIVACVALGVVISIIASGSLLGLYRNIIHKRKNELKIKIAVKDEKALKTENLEKNEPKQEESNKDSLPFDDPF